jgi:uncharacterized protein YndB with AHSA1/START domain
MSQRIVKTVVLKAPREKVWAAISDSKQFGTWFGAEFDGPFVAGQPTQGRIKPTQVDPEVAKLQEPHRDMPMVVLVETLDAPTKLAFRWHPDPVPAGEDPTGKPTTLVEFELSDAPGGTQLRITESGFEAIPLEKRAKVFEGNEGGWEHQSKLIAKYLAR